MSKAHKRGDTSLKRGYLCLMASLLVLELLVLGADFSGASSATWATLSALVHAFGFFGLVLALKIIVKEMRTR